MLMKIPYFNIEGTPGGNQEWFRDFWMHLGGCGALAACDLCVCLANNKGLRSALPFPADELTKDNYVRFGMIMKPYIRPRMGGVTKLSYFTDGCGAYLNRHGYQAEFRTLSGDKSYEEAKTFLKDSISNDLPVAYLNLSHRNPALKDLWWHWFSVTGYEESEERIKIFFHTYGEELSVDFEDLWKGALKPKGGMAALSRISRL